MSILSKFYGILMSILCQMPIQNLYFFIVGAMQRVRPRNGILGLVLVVLVVVLVPLRSEFICEL